MGASEASVAVKAIKFNGLAGTNDGYSNNNGAATTAPTSGNITTANANESLIGTFRGDTIPNPETRWTIPAAGTLMENLVVSSPGTYAATWTTTSSSYVANIAAFKVSASAQVVPIVTTPPVGLLSNISADLLGFISADGGATITAIGFNWGLTTAYGNTVAGVGVLKANRQFLASLSGLFPNTTYHFRAFATNSAGTGFSSDATFTTNARGNPISEVLLNASQLGTSGSDTGGTTKANLLDGNNFTIWSTSVLNTWAGIDCGIATTLTRVRLSPVPAFEDGAVGVEIQGSNDSTFATGVMTLFTVQDRLDAAALKNEIIIGSSGGPYRYYRVLSPSTWYLADVDFLGVYAAGVSGQCADPVISPPRGNFDTPTRIRISCVTSNATIHYTLDGSTPTTSSHQYTGPFVLSANTQINAIAVSAGLTNSRVVMSTFLCPSILYSHQLRWDDRNYNLNATQGCFFHDPVSGYWYEYLVCQDNPARESIVSHSIWQGYNCYRSADLRNWTYVGKVLDAPAGQALGYTTLALRLQMFYCPATGLYVAWTSPDSLSNGLQAWTSPYPDGQQPWTLAASYTVASPTADGFTGGGSTTYGDIGGFIDPSTGKAYLIYNYNNNGNTAFSQLDPSSFTNTLGVGVNSASYPAVGEGHTVFYRSGTYFYLSSQFAGNAYALNQYSTATSPIGPYSGTTNPFQGVTGMPNLPAASGGLPPDNTKAYQSQTDQVLSIPGRGDNFIWAGDDNQPSQTTLKFATRLMMPVAFPTSSTFTIKWGVGAWFDGTAYSPWALDTVFPTVSGTPAAATDLSGSLSGGSASLSWTNNEPNPANIYLDRSLDAAFSVNLASEVLPVGATSFIDSVDPAGGMFYRVRAVNASGTSVSVSFQLPISAHQLPAVAARMAGATTTAAR